MSADELLDQLRASVVGEVSDGAALAELTTLRVGGPARALVTAERDEDLAAVGRACRAHGVGHLVVGRGSNLLVADAGWPGIAVRLGRGFRGVEVDGEVAVLGAAEPMPTVAVRLADADLGAIAWAAGVPGTVGGGVRMNAGAHGIELADHLVEVDLVRLSSGVRETWPAELLGLSYRHSRLPDDAIVVAATLRLPRASRDEVRAEISEVRAWRRAHQPINEPNCGSVFTNPPGDSAGRLVELVGGKRLHRGGARVSERHANFIVTSSGATAADVHGLIRELRDRVEAETGVRLRPEVVTVGLGGWED